MSSTNKNTLNFQEIQKDFNLTDLLSRCTSKKDVATGFYFGYLMVCSIFFTLVLDVHVGPFFLCGIMWMLLPSNILTPSQFQFLLNTYPFLTKIFYFRPTPFIKVKEGD